MAHFQVDIEKRIGMEYFTNVYYVQADTIVPAAAASARIANFESQFHKTNVVFTQARARTVAPGDDQFVNTPLGFTGLVAHVPDQAWPLFNVCRVDFGVATGRPSRKYYRLPLLEAEVTGGVIVQALRDGIVDQWELLVADLGGVGVQHVDIDNQLIVSCVPYAAVGMRQLRRGSRRRTTPVL